MSRLRANQITNENAMGGPNFPHGLTVTGVVTATTSQTMSSIVVGSAHRKFTRNRCHWYCNATQFKGDGCLTGIDASSLKSVVQLKFRQIHMVQLRQVFIPHNFVGDGSNLTRHYI